MVTKIRSYLQLMRIPQWVKNIFIFLPLFFAFKTTEISLLVASLWAFVGFCFVASSVYIINDWNDMDADRLHPTKKKRPLASGAVNNTEALCLTIALFATSVLIYGLILKNYHALILLLIYFVLNILYSVKLKQIPIVDLSIVAIGFVIRVFIGGIVTDIPLSRWIIIMTFLVAVFFVLGKRRDDVVILEKTGNKTRKNLDGYNLTFLNSGIIIVSAIIMVSYLMYTMSPEITERNGDNLYLTSFFVFIGLLRYLQIIFIEEKGGSPTRVFFKDRFIHIVLLCWVVSFFVISMFFK